MTTDDITDRRATGSDLFALPNAAMRSSSCAPATKPLVFSQAEFPKADGHEPPHIFHRMAMFRSKLH